MLLYLYTYHSAHALFLSWSVPKFRLGEELVRSVKTTCPLSVIKMVCLNCADLLPSFVAVVQVSGQTTFSCLPSVIIGSIVNI